MVSQREIVDDFALKRVSISGDEILCSCPYSANHLHGDVHPSFRLNASKGRISASGAASGAISSSSLRTFSACRGWRRCLGMATH